MDLAVNNNNPNAQPASGATNVGPTVLVKKNDGTTVKMSLADFRKIKKDNSVVDEIATIEPKVEEKPVEATKKTKLNLEELIGVKMEENKVYDFPEPAIKPLVLSKTVMNLDTDSDIQIKKMPIENIPEKNTEEKIEPVVLKVEKEKQEKKIDPIAKPTIKEKKETAIQKKVNSNFKSLLEEDLPLKNKLQITPVQFKNKESEEFVDKVLFEAKINIGKDLRLRMITLLDSWKRGVRDDNKFIYYIVRSIDEGGIGLSIDDGEKMLKAMKKIQNQALSFDNTTQELSTTAPVKEIFVDEAKFKQSIIDKKQSLDVFDLSTTPVVVPKNIQPQGRFIEPSQVINKVQRNQGRAIINDIQPPVLKITTGPEEEIANFSLVDFRRLSNKPEDSADKLLEKFESWKKDSYLLYLKTLELWRMSPLYREYVGVCQESLKTGKEIKEILSYVVKDKINESEYLALVKVNQKLSI